MFWFFSEFYFSLDKKGSEEKSLDVQEIRVINSNKSDSGSNNNDKGSECPTTEKEEKDDDSENNLNLPKMPFVDFIANNLYCNSCCKSNKQKLITLSNQIIYKYYSIENILYNQIKFENLLNDYKWNNPKLKNVQNNKTIIEIRNNLQIWYMCYHFFIINNLYNIFIIIK